METNESSTEVKDVKQATMSEEEACQLYEAHASGLLLRFESYYKYAFTFRGNTGPLEVLVTFGGDSEAIYRREVRAEPFAAPPTLRELQDRYQGLSIAERATGHT